MRECKSGCVGWPLDRSLAGAAFYTKKGFLQKPDSQLPSQHSAHPGPMAMQQLAQYPKEVSSKKHSPGRHAPPALMLPPLLPRRRERLCHSSSNCCCGRRQPRGGIIKIDERIEKLYDIRPDNHQVAIWNLRGSEERCSPELAAGHTCSPAAQHELRSHRPSVASATLLCMLALHAAQQQAAQAAAEAAARPAHVRRLTE